MTLFPYACINWCSEKDGFFFFFFLPLLYKIDLYLIQPVHVLDDLMKVCERAPGESDIGRNLKECIIRHNLIELTHRE